jgi:hypothetical protein
MKRLVLAALSIVLVAALIPPALLAKGGGGTETERETEAQAEIVGPGLGEPILLGGNGGPGGDLVMRLAETSGLFTAALGRRPRWSPDPMLRDRPRGHLGPGYTITFTMPGPNGKVARLTQDLYPYAKLSPVPYIVPGQTVTYTKAGQPFFGSEKTRGGWYVATTYLEDNLVAAGLPENPPTGGGGSELPWTVIGALVAFGLGLVLAALLIRRHSQRRTVTA